MLEIERKVDCLYDLTHKIYNSLNKPTIINADSKQLYKSDVLNNDNQTENSNIMTCLWIWKALNSML